MYKILPLFIVVFGLQMLANAQENSPYSRYGIGDLVPNHNILSRGMGGISAGILDYQSINFVNPATLGSISNTIFDLGAEADVRVLRSTNPAKKFTSANSLFSYLQLAFPLASKKMLRHKINWGMSLGLRPVSRINYKIEKNERLSGIDSLNTTYEGSGGVNQAVLGTGISFDLSKDNKHIRKISFGINGGYMFGSKDFSTKLTFINDSVDYFRSNSADSAHFGGFFMSGGLLYETSLSSGILRLGVYGSLQQQINSNRNITRETFSYDANGNAYRVDSIYDQKNVSGTIDFPSTIGAGFSFQGKHWLYGLDYEITDWTKYKFNGVSDQLQSSWVIRAGAQYFPANEKTAVKKYFNFVRYRAGLYYGPDYVKLNTNRPEFGFTLGTGMPLTSLQRLSYSGEYVVLNTALEFAARGDKTANLKENTFRFSVGISMNARWFQKRKYD